MPFAYDLLDEEEQKKQDQAQGGDQAAPAMTGGGESFGGEGGGAQAPQQSNGEKGTSKQGSGFVNLDKYMTANQGNNFGDQVTGKVQGDVDQAKQTLTDTSAGFTDASNQGTTRWNDVQGTVKGYVDNAGDTTTADDAKSFQGYSNAQYQGPESFLGSTYGTQAQGAIQKSAQEANALQTEGGRFALLDQFYGRPKYSMGEKSLDNLLVQNTPGVAAKATSIGNQAKQLSASAGQSTQDLDNLATTNRAATQETGKQTRDYMGNAVNEFTKGLEDRYKSFGTDRDAYNQARRDDLSDDAFDEETLALLGLGDGSSLYDVNLASYLKENENGQGTVGEFATDQDYARYLALQQLSGEEGNLLSAEDRAKAGTANGRLGADKDRLTKDITDRKAQYESRIAPVQQAIETTNAEYERKRAILHRYGPPRYMGEIIGEGPMPDNTYNALAAAVNKQKSALDALQGEYSQLQSIYGANRKATKA